MSKPALVRGDGPMQKQRRWFKQFYSAPGPPIIISKETNGDASDTTVANVGDNKNNSHSCLAQNPSLEF
jgi:hypothetical protein